MPDNERSAELKLLSSIIKDVKHIQRQAESAREAMDKMQSRIETLVYDLDEIAMSATGVYNALAERLTAITEPENEREREQN